jgi:glycosyltransferase involved in cell wall biosynthesis
VTDTPPNAAPVTPPPLHKGPELRPAPKSLTVLVPIYNEQPTAYEILKRVAEAPVVGLERDIVVCDDGSKDATIAEVERFQRDHPEARLTLIKHEKNAGKGSAVRTALSHARGDVVIIQDGDLEYDPKDYPLLLAPLVDGRADAVFGSRFLGGPHRVLYFWHYVINRFLTLLSNIVTNYNLTDMEVGYKALRRDVANALHLRAKRFEIEPEITAKLARGRYKLYEVPISYSGRSYEEGKKIGAWDGVAALYYIFRFRIGG